MNRFQANDLRNLVAEVVSAYQAEKRNKWLLESPEVIEEGVFDPASSKQSSLLADQAVENPSQPI